MSYYFQHNHVEPWVFQDSKCRKMERMHRKMRKSNIYLIVLLVLAALAVVFECTPLAIRHREASWLGTVGIIGLHCVFT